MRFLRLVSFGFFLFGMLTSASAQWTSQSITLTPGWNAVFLTVQPEPRDADTVFSNIPAESVWDWQRISFNPQFIDDMNQLIPQSGEWATWYPVGHAKRPLSNLLEVRGGRPLLIYLNGISTVNWQVTGTATRPLNQWLPSGFTLTGFHVESPGAPTFASYFANSAAHVGTPASSTRPIVRSLDSSGRWVVISSTSTIQPGKAYWVETLNASTYAGPLAVSPPSTLGVQYGLDGTELDITFDNSNSTGNRTVNLKLLSSLVKPAAAQSFRPVAGDVRLSFRDFANIGQDVVAPRWVPFDSPMSITVEPGVSKVLRLAVRRADFLPPVDSTGAFALYQSLLEVREGGVRQLIPVTAMKSFSSSATSNRTGLWVGTVTVNSVNWIGGVSPRIKEANPNFNGSDRNTPRPTNSEFNFRVIMHVDSRGTSRLLQKVMQVWENGQYQPDPVNPGLLLPSVPGQYRLFTDEEKAQLYVGTALRDGTMTARRISTPIFGIHEPITMTTSGGVFGDGGAAVAATVTTGYDDPISPFKHLFHPQHDNFTSDYQGKLPVGTESWNLDRDVRLAFTSTHPFNQVSPQYGDSELGGDYTETIRGISRQELKVAGKFLLHRASNTSAINVTSSTLVVGSTTAPIVTDPTSSAITTEQATAGAVVTSDGGATITDRGIVYAATDINSDPLIGGLGVTKVAKTGTTGAFTVILTGLLPGKTYSFNAYATNSQGTSYTSVATFTTLSTDANLSSLALSSGTLSPAFASATTNYTASVANETTSITVTPTRAQANATIQARVNGGAYASVSSGSASAALALNEGSNTVDVLVTAQDGVTTKTYTVTVTRMAAPTVTTPTATSITGTGATLGGNVTSDGGATITERGVVYSTTANNNNPLIGGTGVTKAIATGTTGVFTSAVTGLTKGTAYSYKAYAINSQGTSYSVLGSFVADSTSLQLLFENNATGVAGETPTTSSGLSYAAGVNGQGAVLGNPNQLRYLRSENIDPRQGTLEFWIKPQWAGNDGLTHSILKMGGGGGMLFGKDGANNLRCIFNRFSANSQPEVGTSINVSAWQAGVWRYVAFTWGGGQLRLYVNGVLQASTAVASLPDIDAAITTFQIGGDESGDYISATIDELRLSSEPLTAQEIQQTYSNRPAGIP
jgi:hypothetical protein